MKEYSFRTSVQLMKKEMGYHIHTNLLQTEHSDLILKFTEKPFFDKGIQKYLNVLGSAPPPPLPLQNN